MPTPNDVRKIAMALEGVSEIDHWNRPAWRTTKRIFAVMRPDGLYLHLPDERKEFLFEAAPDVFVKHMWGKTANVIVQIGKVSTTELAALIGEAWTHCLPPAKPARKTRTKAPAGTAPKPARRPARRLAPAKARKGAEKGLIRRHRGIPARSARARLRLGPPSAKSLRFPALCAARACRIFAVIPRT